MTRGGQKPCRRPSSERGGGSMSVWVLILIPVLLLVIGLVVDGGRQTAAGAEAQAAAVAAARAGSDAAATDLLAGADPAGTAAAAARDYLSAAGVHGSVSATGGTIRVTTTQSRPTLFLSAIGIGQVSGTGQATAQLYKTGDTP
ncbi:pilus assembly protein TadE [Acidipropionibacterium acidipropionici]|uniref:Pilus assembly protein TadE n=1 Tax=Acidipropionibacterium acidipropionici TaxID=1748 RepID=A0AAC9FBQ4_9ACTN|nr:pilus assembly protein TadE [Acidipropionibacterium acidipropionici]